MEDNLPAMTQAPKFLRKLVMKHYFLMLWKKKKHGKHLMRFHKSFPILILSGILGFLT